MGLKNQIKSNSTGKSAEVLIPVDFSPRSDIAIRVGFELAKRLESSVTLLHASAIASPLIFPQYADEIEGLDVENMELDEIELEKAIDEIDSTNFKKLEKKLKKLIADSEIQDIKYRTLDTPGMPEDVITEYCTQFSPRVVVMSTRPKRRRDEEVMGSVTVEVIDKCKSPILNVPEDYSFTGFKSIKSVLAFCNFDEGDIHSISTFMKLFGNPEIEVMLYPANNKLPDASRKEALEKLCQTLEQRFPFSGFSYNQCTDKNFEEEIKQAFVDTDVQMVIAPQKKRNAISRFFNPGVAHKILYSIDIPMLVTPVVVNR